MGQPAKTPAQGSKNEECGRGIGRFSEIRVRSHPKIRSPERSPSFAAPKNLSEEKEKGDQKRESRAKHCIVQKSEKVNRQLADEKKQKTKGGACGNQKGRGKLIPAGCRITA